MPLVLGGRTAYADPDQPGCPAGYQATAATMTNWLITQPTLQIGGDRAGAVEHAANWGNDDETWDDAWYPGWPAVGEP